MRRVAYALLLLALVAAPGAVASEDHPTSLEVQEELWCADCDTTFAEANATHYTQDALKYIDTLIAAGDSKSEIKDKVAARFNGHLLVMSSKSKTRSNPLTLADFEDEVMCPICNTTLDQSSSPAARQIEDFISTRIAAGDSKSEIKDQLVAEYGPQILAAPPKEGFDLLAWLLPVAGLLGGALVLALLAWRWSRGREPTAVAGELDPALERRVDQELARFDEG